MSEQQQLHLPFSPTLKPLISFSFTAIYFTFGMYNEDDVREGGISEELIGFDCPFDDSALIQAYSERELIDLINQAYECGRPSQRGEITIEEKCAPDVIVDRRGKLLPELYERIFPGRFDPNKIMYSLGRETLTTFWEREKWHWFPNYS